MYGKCFKITLSKVCTVFVVGQQFEAGKVSVKESEVAKKVKSILQPSALVTLNSRSKISSAVSWFFL